jgi:glutamine synthetase
MTPADLSREGSGGTTDDVAAAASLKARGIRMVRGTFVDCAGVIRAKQVPVDRLGTFASCGIGAAPCWAVFCIDDAIAFTPRIGPVGDLRLRLDVAALRQTDEGHASGPVDLVDQQGAAVALCARDGLRRQQAALADLGVSVRAAMEIEMTCFDAATGQVTGPGGYGLRPLLEQEAFLDDVAESFGCAGLAIEQLHAEYGPGQFELSMAPMAPLHAADAAVLARQLLSTAALRQGIRVSFSPQPLPGGVGNGAHVHLSLERTARPLLSQGPGPHGLGDGGSAVIAGLLAGLPDAAGLLAPSLLSAERLQPGHWAGAFACWGLENREAALRLCAATAGNPYGAHLEVKCVDPSANPYVVLAVLLGLARHGLEAADPAPPEVAVDPQQLAESERLDRGIVALGRDQAAVLDAVEASPALTEILGQELIEALVAVRRHEVEIAKGSSHEALIEQFRFAWSA